MGFFEWLGFGKPRDAPAAEPELPDIQDNVRDSGQTFMFGRAESGERVDEKSSLQIATVYACVRLLAETVASLPLHLYRYKGEDGKERATDHPLYKILYRQVNSEMTSFSFRECMMTHVDGLLRGDYQSRMNGYSIAFSNGFMSPNEIRRLENMNPIPAEDGGDDYFLNGSYTKLKDAGSAYGVNTEGTPPKEDEPDEDEEQETKEEKPEEESDGDSEKQPSENRRNERRTIS